MTERDTHPNASHYSFPYYFTDNDNSSPDGGNKHGISFNQYFLNYYGDLIIHYDISKDEWDDGYIDCWCSRWDVDNYSVTIETWLKETDFKNLMDNIKPGAVGELYTILGRPKYYDKTWSDSNSLKIIPNNAKRREKLNQERIGNNRSSLTKMRKEIIMYPKNVTSSPVKGSSGWIYTKIEGYISESGDL